VDGQGNRVFFPENGALMCAGVRVFRDAAARCFAPLAGAPVELTVLCIWLPNLRPRFCQVDADWLGQPKGSMDTQSYAAKARQKFETVVTAATEVGVESLVISDAGCKELCNDAFLFGHTFGKTLALLNGPLTPQVVLSGTPRFRQGVQDGIRSVRGGDDD